MSHTWFICEYNTDYLQTDPYNPPSLTLDNKYAVVAAITDQMEIEGGRGRQYLQVPDLAPGLPSLPFPTETEPH